MFQKEEQDPEIRKSKFWEIAFFLSLIYISLVLPAVFFGLEDCSFTTLATITILRNIGLSALVFGILKLRGEPFSKIGWTKKELNKNFLLGALIFPFFYYSVSLVLDLFIRLGLSHIEEVPASLMPKSLGQILLGVILVLVVALGEEIIFRGYLLKRIEEITASTPLAVLSSTLLFAFGHAYEGGAGMVAVGYIGLVFSLLFRIRLRQF